MRFTGVKIIVEIAGGLGNQMFQYALYLRLKSLKYNCKLYYDSFKQLHNGFELNRVFDLGVVLADKLEVDFLMDVRQDKFSKIKRKLVGRKPSYYWEHDKDYSFKPNVFVQQKHIYLQGCWLSEKYFKDIEGEIRKSFAFCNNLDKANYAIHNQIFKDANPVSLHIRRGDYLKNSINLNIDYKNYLNECIVHITKKISNPSFYVFSDDINYARDILKSYTGNNNFFFIDWNKGENSFYDMQLMSICKHNIIANSTFSWWGAWLNRNEDKVVISPKQWFSKDELNINSIIPESWIAK